jgi:hypothetical protein
MASNSVEIPHPSPSPQWGSVQGACPPIGGIFRNGMKEAGVEHCYGIVGDTLNAFASNLAPAGIKFIHMRHEEAGAFAAQGEALLLNRLTAVAGSCGPGSLHFINGLYEANRNRAPVILIASQVVQRELGFDFIQEVDFKAVYTGDGEEPRGGGFEARAAPLIPSQPGIRCIASHMRGRRRPYPDRSFRQVKPIWYKPVRFSIGNILRAMHHSARSSAGT